MTVDEMVAEVQAHGFSMTTSTRIIRWLNEAYETLVRKTRLGVFENFTDLAFTVGVTNMALPATATSILAVTDMTSGGVPLERITGGEADLASPQMPAGPPQAYRLQGLSGTQALLYLLPTPNTSYTIRARYLGVPTLLVAGTGEPSFPSYYHDALVSYAISRCYRQEDDPQQAVAFMADFDRRAAEMIVALSAENVAPMQVPGTWAPLRSSPWSG